MPSRIIFSEKMYNLFANTINEIGVCMVKMTNTNIKEDTYNTARCQIKGLVPGLWLLLRCRGMLEPDDFVFLTDLYTDIDSILAI
jgi:hypothetical protein